MLGDLIRNWIRWGRWSAPRHLDFAHTQQRAPDECKNQVKPRMVLWGCGDILKFSKTSSKHNLSGSLNNQTLVIIIHCVLLFPTQKGQKMQKNTQRSACTERGDSVWYNTKSRKRSATSQLDNQFYLLRETPRFASLLKFSIKPHSLENKEARGRSSNSREPLRQSPCRTMFKMSMSFLFFGSRQRIYIGWWLKFSPSHSIAFRTDSSESNVAIATVGSLQRKCAWNDDAGKLLMSKLNWQIGQLVLFTSCTPKFKENFKESLSLLTGKSCWLCRPSIGLFPLSETRNKWFSETMLQHTVCWRPRSWNATSTKQNFEQFALKTVPGSDKFVRLPV